VTIRLGVIGLSPGNGHPYSWSAIINGYDREVMARCPFPAIPAYLAQHRFPKDQIKGARVTHVWTQNPADTQLIAQASLIDNTVARYQDMIGAVDGVLLARDDAEKHVEIALPFLSAGVAVYVDKPFATTVASAHQMLAAVSWPGQLFTGSALTFAPELQIDAQLKSEIGEVREIIATTPKRWATYAPHIVEPVLQLMSGETGLAIDVFAAETDCGAAKIGLGWESGAQATLVALGVATVGPIRLQVYGSQGHRDLTFHDSFGCFRAALEAFLGGMRTRSVAFDEQQMLSAVQIYERGITG